MNRRLMMARILIRKENESPFDLKYPVRKVQGRLRKKKVKTENMRAKNNQSTAAKEEHNSNDLY